MLQDEVVVIDITLDTQPYQPAETTAAAAAAVEAEVAGVAIVAAAVTVVASDGATPATQLFIEQNVVLSIAESSPVDLPTRPVPESNPEPIPEEHPGNQDLPQVKTRQNAGGGGTCSRRELVCLLFCFVFFLHLQGFSMLAAISPLVV